MHRSFGDSVLIAGACLFASWTAFCYVLVLFELSFSELRAWSFVPFAIGLVIMALCKEKAVSPYHRGIETVNQPSASINIHPKSVWLLLILTLTAVTLRSLDLVYWLVWVILLSTSIIVFRAVSAPVVKCPQVMIVRSNWVTVGIAALMVFGAALVAFTHRPDQDDSQYLNFVVTAIDFPFDPLFSHSGLWQEPGVPLEQPIYRFHTYELLIAALSDIFNVPHKTLYYLILAPIFGGIAVLVHWRLAEYLVPQYALSVLLAWLVLIIALGASHQEFGNFAFVRLFQSKSLLVTIGLPLCLLLGLRFAEVPDVPRALTLGMGIIASTGLTTSALATVPFVVGATLCGGLVGASRGAAMRLISGGLVSGLFLCAIGFFLIASTKSVTGVHGVSWSGSGAGLSTVLGDGVLGALILVLFPIAPLFVVGYKRQKLYALTSLIFVGLVVNPWMADFLAKNLNEALAWATFLVCTVCDFHLNFSGRLNGSACGKRSSAEASDLTFDTIDFNSRFFRAVEYLFQQSGCYRIPSPQSRARGLYPCRRNCAQGTVKVDNICALLDRGMDPYFSYASVSISSQAELFQFWRDSTLCWSC